MNKKIPLLVLALVALCIFMVIYNKSPKHCEKKDGTICKINIEGSSLELKVAYSKEAQQQGLMWVDKLEDNAGMIFVYDKPEYLSFWMKNTIIPLSIAFVEPDGKISIIYDMYPQPGKSDRELPTYASPTTVKYAIEAPLGWFALKNIKRNSYVKIPEELR